MGGVVGEAIPREPVGRRDVPADHSAAQGRAFEDVERPHSRSRSRQGDGQGLGQIAQARGREAEEREILLQRGDPLPGPEERAVGQGCSDRRLPGSVEAQQPGQQTPITRHRRDPGHPVEVAFQGLMGWGGLRPQA